MELSLLVSLCWEANFPTSHPEFLLVMYLSEESCQEKTSATLSSLDFLDLRYDPESISQEALWHKGLDVFSPRKLNSSTYKEAAVRQLPN